MIGWLSGVVVRKSWPTLILDAGGVGYSLSVPRGTFDALPDRGGSASLEVLTLVRQDAIQLFGFANETEKRLFETLLGISGVGPRLALALLSGVSTPVLVDAVRREDAAVLESVPGIGRKTARRIAMELRDRLDELLGADAGPEAGAAGTVPAVGLEADAVAALESLGYRRAEAERAVGSTAAAAEARPDLPTLIRESLRLLGRT